MKLTNEMIDKGIKLYPPISKSPLHENFDSIRIAYEWFDAQVTTRTINRLALAKPLKHIIEKWGGLYVSQDDVAVAAHLHPSISGKYPYFNISQKLTEPSLSRLSEIPSANTHGYRTMHNPDIYKYHEQD